VANGSDSKQTLLIGGLAVVAVVGGVTAYALTKTKTPPPSGCTSNSQCPPGYICVNGECVQPTGCTSNSQCPPNYVCENGACVPVGQCGTQGAPCSSTTQCCSGYTCVNGICTSCPTGSCSCSEFWDPVQCSCQPLVPAQIITGEYQYNLDWLIFYSCSITGEILKCITFCQSGYSKCAPCIFNLTAGNSSASATLELQGQLTTSAGEPICNQLLGLRYPSPFTYTPTSGEYTVVFSVTGPSTVTTDANGNFSVNAQYTATLTYMDYFSACGFSASSTNAVNNPVAVDVYVQNDPTVANSFLLNVANTVKAETYLT